MEYTHATLEYLFCLKNILSRMVRERFEQHLRDETREFLRFVSEPYAPETSRTYLAAQQHFIQRYLPPNRNIEFWDTIFANQQIAVVMRYYREIFEYINTSVYNEDHDDFLFSQIHLGVAQVYVADAGWESLFKNGVLYSVCSPTQMDVNLQPYYNYITRRREPVLPVSVPQYYLAKQQNVERAALWQIGEWVCASNESREKVAVY